MSPTGLRSLFLSIAKGLKVLTTMPRVMGADGSLVTTLIE